jgi:tripartite-type tricarboxylate transporter receptor subunit TctC
MKKILSLLLFTITFNVNATQTVQVFWPYTLGSNQATMARTLVDNANKIQDKYQFIFVMKPGAGGIIAVNSTLNSPGLNIIVHSSSFYTVPYNMKDSYDVDKFTVVTEVCVDRPLAVYSKKLTVLTGHNKELSAGITPGGVLSLVPKLINKNSTNVKLFEVSYKGATDSTVDLLSGILDTTVDWLSSYRTQSNLNILGITGKRSLAGAKTFQSQGIKGLDTLVTDVLVFAPKGTDDTVLRELNAILNESNADKLATLCQDDFGRVSKPSMVKASTIHQENKQKWHSLLSD